MSIYVSPNGNDSFPGTQEQPKASFAAGLGAWKTAIVSATEDIGLYLERGGVYNVASTQYLGSANNHPVSGKRLKIGAYGEGETPFLTARQQVTGWSLDGGSVVSAALASLPSPAVLQDVWCNDGTELRICSYGRDDDGSRIYQWGTVATTKHARVPTASLPSVASWGGVYFVSPQGWNISRLRIAAVTPVDATYSDVTFEGDDADIEFAKGDLSQPGPTYSLGMGFPNGPYHNNSGQRFWFENAPEFLTAPGDFYHDTTNGRLRVYLPEGVPSASAFEAKGIFVSNGVETVLQINGVDVDTKIRNLDIEDIGFKHVGFNLKDDGYYCGYVGGASLIKSGASSYAFRSHPSALYLYYASSISIRRCTFRDLGCIGLRTLWGVHGLHIAKNAFYRIGSSAWVIGAAPFPNFSDASLAAQNLDLVAEQNVVVDTGRRWMGSALWCGVWRGGIVRNNTIRRCTDGGISFSTGARCYGIWVGDFQVCANDIAEVMTLTVDGGAIYSSGNLSQNKLSASPANLDVPRKPARIYRNRIRDVRASGFDPGGGHTGMIYWDLGSEGNMAWRNDCDDGDLFFLENCGRFNFVKDNKVGSDVDELEHISYSGFNVVVDAGGVTVSTTEYYPPLNNPPNATDIAKFDGTGGYNPFKSVVPFATATACFKSGTTDYQSLSLRENNNSSVQADSAGAGVDAATAAMHAEYLSSD